MIGGVDKETKSREENLNFRSNSNICREARPLHDIYTPRLFHMPAIDTSGPFRAQVKEPDPVATQIHCRLDPFVYFNIVEHLAVLIGSSRDEFGEEDACLDHHAYPLRPLSPGMTMALNQCNPLNFHIASSCEAVPLACHIKPRLDGLYSTQPRR
jgi:hypothetical protein